MWNKTAGISPAQCPDIPSFVFFCRKSGSKSIVFRSYVISTLSPAVMALHRSVWLFAAVFQIASRCARFTVDLLRLHGCSEHLPGLPRPSVHNSCRSFEHNGDFAYRHILIVVHPDHHAVLPRQRTDQDAEQHNLLRRCPCRLVKRIQSAFAVGEAKPARPHLIPADVHRDLHQPGLFALFVFLPESSRASGRLSKRFPVLHPVPDSDHAAAGSKDRPAGRCIARP